MRLRFALICCLVLDNKLLHRCCSLHVVKLGGRVTVKNYLGISASVLIRPLCAGGASQQAVLC